MHLIIEVLIVIAISALVYVEARLGRMLAREPLIATLYMRVLRWHTWMARAILALVIGNVLFIEAVRRHIPLKGIDALIFDVHLAFAFSFLVGISLLNSFFTGSGKRKASHAWLAYATSVFVYVGMSSTGLYLAYLTL